ncbi:MAG: hypothetical protein IPH78_15090 [Bacteroidetes bacterium]|nr:hypothetical protein [Bacteroidota bacterium]
MDTTAPYNVDTTHVLFSRIDSVIKWCDELGLNLIIDNHHGWTLNNQAWRPQLYRFAHLECRIGSPLPGPGSVLPSNC